MKTLDHDKIEELAVRVDDLEVPLESVADYSIRFRSSLPNFPDEVISQWFYEHRQAIYSNSWLPLPQLRFCHQEFSIDALHSAFSANPIVEQYRIHFESTNTSRRMARIAEFVLNHGTWPCAPIVLANPSRMIVSPWGMKCDFPYHLLEGHHRFAVLLANQNRAGVAHHHKLWVAEFIDDVTLAEEQ